MKKKRCDLACGDVVYFIIRETSPKLKNSNSFILPHIMKGTIIDVILPFTTDHEIVYKIKCDKDEKVYYMNYNSIYLTFGSAKTKAKRYCQRYIDTTIESIEKLKNKQKYLEEIKIQIINSSEF